MSIQGRILEKVLRLPPALTRDVQVIKNIRIPMPDGVELVADLYRTSVPDAPTVMSRTPYGRIGMTSRATGYPFAERGFNVLIQSCRGTHGGSGGIFDPFIDEEKDGLATIDWIERQPWYNGKLFTFGPSYVGFTQLTLLPGAGNRVAGAYPMIISSAPREILFQGGAFFTALAVQWIRRITLLERSAYLADFVEVIGDRRARKAMHTLPIGGADVQSTGKQIPYFRQWLDAAEDPLAPYWTDRSVRHRMGDITAPVHLHAGWHDFLLPGQLDDYSTMTAAGRTPYLTVGPWIHVSSESARYAIPNATKWFGALAKQDPALLPSHPVRLYVQGAEEWRNYESYPPAGVVDRQWHLHSDGFSADPAREAAPRRFRWDPTDPTPDFGGAMLDPKLSGRKDQAGREARADILVYSSEPLIHPLELIGPLTAHIKVRTSGPYGDLFIRLCDVDDNGVSTNVCDGIQRMDDIPVEDDGTRTVTVRIWPTAYRFKPGHRLRVQLCGGSFPHFARNTGTGEPLASATRLVPVDYEILPGSTLTLPIFEEHPPQIAG